MYLSPSRLLRFLIVTLVAFCALPAHAQVAVQSSPFTVNTSDGVRIYVNHKFGPAPLKIPVLLIHGTWGNGGTWDFPGRSVMDYLATRGYDVYALDMRGMGHSDNPGYANIDISSRVEDARAVAYQIRANTRRADHRATSYFSSGTGCRCRVTLDGAKWILRAKLPGHTNGPGYPNHSVVER